MIKKHQQLHTQSGFSLVEFIVVIVIFSIMSSVSLFNYNQYRNTIKETNIAQDLGLSLRQAQVYGISASDQVIGAASLDQNGAADNLFSRQIPDITNDRSIRGVVIFPQTETITLYEDVNDNFVYNENTDRIIDTRTIQDPQVDLVGVDLCDSAPNCGQIETDRVDISFRRPYPDAYINKDGNPSQQFGYASIIIDAGGSSQSYIEVNSIGNITVKKNYET